VPRLPTVEGLIEPRLGNPYMGRHATHELDALVQLGRRNAIGKPREDIEDGCPGAWYRTPFVDSVDRYTRDSVKGGGRVDNPFFTSAPWQVQAAVIHLEREEARCRAYIDGVVADRRAVEDKKRERQQQAGRPAKRVR
jgi:hypothetical protein